ncbi:MAG: hypothetical protein QNK11_03605 [Legionella sp.]|nr:hypothetical protein [Legionella sp.]
MAEKEEDDKKVDEANDDTNDEKDDMANGVLLDEVWDAYKKMFQERASATAGKAQDLTNDESKSVEGDIKGPGDSSGPKPS